MVRQKKASTRANNRPDNPQPPQRPHQHRPNRLKDTCAICSWDGTDPDIWGPGRIQQWATTAHDLCTRDSCRAEYNRRARAGEL